MRNSLDGHDLRRGEAYPEGDTSSLDKRHVRQDLVVDWENLLTLKAPFHDILDLS